MEGRVFSAQNPTYVLLLLHIFLLALLPFKAISSPKTQAQALLSWKNTFDFDYAPPSLPSWSLTNLNNLCNWTAIVCDQSSKQVSQIDLSYFDISATLTHFNFTPFLNLTQFNLNGNNFRGPIPSAIGNLSKLTTLDLAHNIFIQQIPVEIGMLTELKYLDLRENSLHSSIPFELGFCTNLTYLALASNHLEGKIPPSIGQLRELRYLDLGENSLHSSIPSELGLCTNLTHIGNNMF